MLERATAVAADSRAAVLVCLDFGDDGYDEAVVEFVRLAESAGATRHAVVRGGRSRPDPKFFAGSGKVNEIAEAALALNAASVIFNHQLTAAQQRNLEKALGAACSIAPS